jgi:hypothetical protein
VKVNPAGQVGQVTTKGIIPAVLVLAGLGFFIWLNAEGVREADARLARQRRRV